MLLGHTKIKSMVRYLGIDIDDALAISEQVEVLVPWGRAKCSALLPSTGPAMSVILDVTGGGADYWRT